MMDKISENVSKQNLQDASQLLTDKETDKNTTQSTMSEEKLMAPEPIKIDFVGLIKQFQTDEKKTLEQIKSCFNQANTSKDKNKKVVKNLKSDQQCQREARKLLDQTKNQLIQANKVKSQVIQDKQAATDLELAQLENQKTQWQLRVAQAKKVLVTKQDESNKLADQVIEQRNFYDNLDKENNKLSDNIEAKVKERIANQEQLVKLKSLLAERQSEFEQKQQKLATMKDRIELLQRRKNQYYPGYEKRLLNQYLEYKGNIRVFVRMRPILSNDFKAYNGTKESFALIQKQITIHNEQQIEIEPKAPQKVLFNFDRIFGPEATQMDVYAEVTHLVKSCLDGNNVCIFSYGQTGSGKTYTMGTDIYGTAMNDELDDGQTNSAFGIIPRAVRQILQQIDLSSEQIRVSFQEIYLDSVRDLLDSSNKMLQQTAKYEPTSVKVTTSNQVFNLLKKAETNRSVATTACNERSSRSHSIFQIQMPKGQTISLVDLAGSERLTHSKVEGDRLKETLAINKSLSALADVISALKEKKHVPYRNSKLTYTLQSQLSSSSAKVLMIVNLNPISINESLCSLRFASNVNSSLAQQQ